MLQVYHDPASTVPPQMADRIDALRAALEFISTHGVSAADRQDAAWALHEDDRLAGLQNAANEADMRRQDDARAYGWQPGGFIAEARRA